jgi:glycosyltransferase involved in cell wall biosynthesis
MAARSYFSLSRLIYRRKLRWMWRAKAIITVSDHTRRELLKFFPSKDPKKVITIHNGIHPKWRVINDLRMKRQFLSGHGLLERRVVLHVGRDVWYKNFPAVLRAFASLSIEDAVLVKVGILSVQTVALLQENDLLHRFVHFESLSDDELVVLYNVADVFVFPSLSEGFGWPPLEAMACGCPVILSDRGSLGEVGGKACIYVDPEDHKALASAISEVLSNRKVAAELRANGLVHSKKFDWSITAKKMLAILLNSHVDEGGEEQPEVFRRK